jgi:hypothetical protein
MRMWVDRMKRGTRFLLVAGLMPLLAGCWGFTKTLHEAEPIDDDALRQVAESDPAESRAAERPVSWMLVLHPLDLALGEHRLVLADKRRKGSSEIAFSCQPGQVLFARVQAELVPGSFWSGYDVQPTAVLVDSLPPEWSNYRLVLWRSGAWLVAH